MIDKYKMQQLDENELIIELNKPYSDKNHLLISELFEGAFNTTNICFFKIAIQTAEVHMAITTLCLIDDKRALTLLFETCTTLEVENRNLFSRVLGARLASAQSVESLEFSIDSFAANRRAEQILIYWIEEAVLRAKPLSASKLVLSLYESSRQQIESVKLPAMLLPIEKDQPTLAATFSLNGSIAWGKGHKIKIHGGIKQPSVLCEVTAIKTEYFDYVKDIVAASRNEFTKDYLQVEAREFYLASAFTGSYESLLRSLPLVSLCYNELTDNVDFEKGRMVPLTIIKISHQDAFNNLMGLAANGSPYSQNGLGSIGRALAWQSLKGLMASNASNAQEIDLLASECEFISFIGLGGYFNNMVNDVGIMCIRKDRLSVAVFAYSDVD